jgi:hypothetical protein
MYQRLPALERAVGPLFYGFCDSQNRKKSAVSGKSAGNGSIGGN